MIRNYLLVAVRNLVRNRISSLVNILGLAIGMAAFVLIIQYVRSELSYDNFHANQDVIFRIQQDRYNKGQVTTQWAAGCSAVGQALYENFKEVEDFTRFQIRDGVISNGETSFREPQIYLADTSFFELFSFPIVEGDPHTALLNPLEMLVSQSTARKYFGNRSPIGESLQYNGGPELKITGVFMDPPRNSHLKPAIVASWATLIYLQGKGINTAWQWDGFFNYIMLHPETDYKEFESKIPAFVKEQIGNDLEQYGAGVVYHLQPLRSIHLKSDFMFEAEPNGNARSVYALIVIAIFLMAIAWINYINLSSARSLERAREVGMRKVTGALRKQLLGQFLIEYFLVSIIAMILAVLIVLAFESPFNKLTGEQLDYSLASNSGYWSAVLGVFILGALLSGIYPALFLSSFKPVSVFKGVSELKVGGLGMRRVLVIFQFATSILLLAGTLTVYVQITYMKNHDLGVDIENVLVLLGPSVNDSTYSETFSAFKSELNRDPDISMVTASITVPGRQPQWNAGGIRRLSDPEEEGNQYRIVGFDFDFVDFYGLTILAGRNFSEEYGQNSETVLLNEAAVQVMGFEDNESSLGVPIYFTSGEIRSISWEC
jgi:putative ABC transport system permease protein